MSRLMYLILAFVGLTLVGGRTAKAQSIIPIPSEITAKGKPIIWKTIGHIIAADSFANEKDHALRILKERADVTVKSSNGHATLRIENDPTITNSEAYSLTVDETGVVIKGKTRAGVFNGLMTLEQLMLGNGKATTCIKTNGISIKDTPRTHLRVMMIDMARNFIPYNHLKALIPEMARYKLNALHLHLVDNQGWRIEIKSYPKLTDVGSKRIGMDDLQKPIEGFYTQQQMKDLVTYANKYHVMLIPEIEMPGHEATAVHCFPNLTCDSAIIPIQTTTGMSNDLLCPSKEFTYTFLGNVFRELAEIFPCPYIHLGGDEAGRPPLGKWTDCPHCQAMKTKLGISPTNNRADNWKLQKYLFDRIIDTLRTKYHKIPMYWYETDFKEIQKGCIVYAWHNGLTQTAIDAVKANDAKIMLCPVEHCYFDYPARKDDMPEKNWGMPVTSLKQAYALDPSWGNGVTFEKNNLFGVAATHWSECIFEPERISYQAYPRILAIAEAGWSLQKNRSWEDFKNRLVPILRDMQRRGILSFIPDDDIEIK